MTEKDYIKKHLILDAIKSAKPEPSEYMDMTDNIAVNAIILGAAVKQYEDIVKIVEAAQPTECKPVVHAYWIKHGTYAKCSNCRTKIDRLVSQFYSFCPFCSAGMKWESEDNNAVDRTANTGR